MTTRNSPAKRTNNRTVNRATKTTPKTLKKRAKVPKKTAKKPVSEGDNTTVPAEVATTNEKDPNDSEDLDVAEAEEVVGSKRSRGTGNLKNDEDYDHQDSDEVTDNDEMRLEDLSVIATHTPSKKRKKTLDPTTRVWKERATMAERQLKTIAKTRVINSYQEGEVRQYTKQVLWKKVKFITCDATMVRCMKGAANAFEVVEEEQQDWMSTYSHTVREAINQQRNRCCQELRKTILSKFGMSPSVTKQFNYLTQCIMCLLYRITKR